MADAEAPAVPCVTAMFIQPAQLEGAEGQAAEPSQLPPEAERVQYCSGEHAEARMALIVKAAIAYSMGIDKDGKKTSRFGSGGQRRRCWGRFWGP